MKILDLFSEESLQIIQKYRDKPVAELFLQERKNKELDLNLIAAQLDGKRSAKIKLPTLYDHPKIVYPSKLAVEQSSSEITANYKSSLISGEQIIDMTGGLGIDAMAFAKKFNHVYYIEQNEFLALCADHNFKVLNQSNISILPGNSSTVLHTIQGKIDWIYLDPARRKEGQKVFKFNDCEPNILDIKRQLFEISNQIMVKTSPLIDIDAAVEELKNVIEIHIVSVENECKELLFILENKINTGNIKCIAVNLSKNSTAAPFIFNRIEELHAEANFSMPRHYLYEPNSSILKSGAFKLLCSRFELYKIHPNSHLYTSDQFLSNFPGRIFKIDHLVKYDKKSLQEILPQGKANISARNFPDKPESIKKKLGLSDGGDIYLFATTLFNKKLSILVTTKLN